MKMNVNYKAFKRGKLKLCATVLGISIVAGSLSGCNKQVVDFNKVFNVAVETNDDIVSVVNIKGYADYAGDMIQFVTEDDLMVLTSTNKTQLLNDGNTSKGMEYATSLVGGTLENVFSYDELQDISIRTEPGIWNKTIIDFNFTYDQAIIIKDGYAMIVDLATWRDYEEDDKIQLKLTNGLYTLTNTDGVKLVNASNATQASVVNYAYTLVGDKEKISYYSYDHELENETTPVIK